MDKRRNAKAKPGRPPADAAATLPSPVSPERIVASQHPDSAARKGWQLGEFLYGLIAAHNAFRRRTRRPMSGPCRRAARLAASL